MNCCSFWGQGYTFWENFAKFFGFIHPLTGGEKVYYTSNNQVYPCSQCEELSVKKTYSKKNMKNLADYFREYDSTYIFYLMYF